jgi:ABC-type multidrug transport system fused ATPase/permease subunit
VEFIGICAVFFAGLFAVLGRDRDWGISPKDIGLSINYALNVTQILNMMVRVASDLEADIVSVERIKEYSEIPLEVS